MNIQRSMMLTEGRLEIPDEIRAQFGLNDGDQVLLEVVENEPRVRHFNNTLQRVRERFKSLVPEGTLLSDELIADRRAEAARE